MKIGFPHKPQQHGGPGSFQMRFENALKERGWTVVYPEENIHPDVILVVGGTKRLSWLWKNKRKGTKVIHRLDGLDWRVWRLPISLRKKIWTRMLDYLLRVIRDCFADHIVYQSEFVKWHWERFAGCSPNDSSVIYNAVDLKEFYPIAFSGEKKKLVCVEGEIQDSRAYYEPIISLSSHLQNKGLISRTIVCGDVKSAKIKSALKREATIELKGRVPRTEIPAVFHNAVYLPIEVHPPCPNSVIEALACGTPVIGYDTGALKELVPDSAGKIVAYGTNPWKLEVPDNAALFSAAEKVLNQWDEYSAGARKVAEEKYNINDLADKYLDVIRQVLN